MVKKCFKILDMIKKLAGISNIEAQFFGGCIGGRRKNAR
jgi:hypothetical protein